MNLAEIFLLAVSLSMDAFAVSLCKGLALKKIGIKNCAIVGLWFGSFQALMPMAGYFLGSTFADKITSIDHWIAFVLLAIIGGNMIKESFEKDGEKVNDSLGFKTMFVMAIATSIDALAVGVSFAFTDFQPEWFVYRICPYRGDHLYPFRRGCQNRQHFRHQVQIKSGICRRLDPHPFRS